MPECVFGIRNCGSGMPFAHLRMPFWLLGIPIWRSGMPFFDLGTPFCRLGIPIFHSGMPFFRPGMLFLHLGIIFFHFRCQIWGGRTRISRICTDFGHLGVPEPGFGRFSGLSEAGAPGEEMAGWGL
jgi:hypothetical protein